MPIFLKIYFFTLILLSGCGDSQNTLVLQSGDNTQESEAEQNQSTDSKFHALYLNPKTQINLSSILAPTTRGLSVPSPKPQSDDPSYLEASTEYLPEKELNHLQFEKGLRKIVIKGVNIVLDSNPRNPLHQALAENRDVKELEIHAQHLVISGSYSLPSTRVVINTRTLKLEATGMLDLTPKPHLVDAQQFQDGKPGLDAAELIIHTEHVEIENPQRHYFRLKGGRGQNAGRGKNGLRGKSLINVNEEEVILICELSEVPVSGDGSILSTPITRREEENKNLNSQQLMDTSLCAKVTGRNERSGDGENAIAGGAPGLPGKSGQFKVSHSDLLNLGDLSHGSLGNEAPLVKGGPAGLPKVVQYKIVEYMRHRNNRERAILSESIYKVESKPGQDAIAPKRLLNPDLFVGSSELLNTRKALTFANESLPLYHKYIKDLYRTHHYANAYQQILEALENISLVKQEGEADHQTLHYEVQFISMLNKLENNLNLNGLDAYSVPTISAANSALVFNQQLKYSLEALTLVRMVKQFQNQAIAKQAALSETRSHLKNSIERERADYASSILGITQIEYEAQQMGQDVVDFMEYVQSLENQIQAQAKIEIERREQELARQQRRSARSFSSILGTIGSLAMVIPGAQPAGIALGAASNLITNFEQASWQDRLRDAGELYKAVSGVNISRMSHDWNQAYEPLRSVDFNSLSLREKAEYLKNMYEFAKPTVDEVKKQIQKYRGQIIPQTQYDEVVAQIRDNHPEFKVAMSKLRSLNERREALNKKLESSLNKILEQQISILEQSTILANLNVEPQTALATLNSLESRALDDIEQLAQDRLDKAYHYFNRAYYFRTLFSLRSNFDFPRFADRINVLVANYQGPMLTIYPQVENLYRQELNNALDHITNSSLVNESMSTVQINLSGPMLEELSKGTSLYFNLEDYGVFGEHIKNPRIVDISIGEVEFEAPDTSTTSRYVDIIIDHSGVSVFNQEGENYVFTHKDHNFAWGKRLDLSSQRFHSPIRRSNGFETLFSALLEGARVGDNLIYPSARSDLKLQLKGLTNESDSIALESIKINIQYLQSN